MMGERDEVLATSESGPTTSGKSRKRGTSALRRRGFAAGAVALLAAVVAQRKGVDVAEAANGDNLRGGFTVSGVTAPTGLAAAVVSDFALQVSNSGNSGGGILSNATGNVAVYGSTNGTAVLGLSTGANTGVYGTSSGGGVGVAGVSPGNYGVYGVSNSQYGVYGQSANSFGVVGQGTIGCFAQGSTYGILARVPAGQIAGQFDGSVIINGDFLATGMKSAGVRDGAGNLRRVFCVESTLSYFEDFGQGRIGADGSAHIDLDPTFASTVDTNGYYVFLTEIGDNHQLFVASQTPSGFDVRAKTGAVGGQFAFRIVARRRDTAPNRMPLVETRTAPELRPRGLSTDGLPTSVPKPSVPRGD